MESFETFLIIKGLQPVTVSGHVKGVSRIVRSIGKEPDIAEARAFIANLYVSAYSYTYKMNQAKSLEYWMEYKGTPTHFGRQRKPKPLIKDTLSESEVTRLFMSTHGSRERALLSLLAFGGIRPKELCRLKVSEVNLALKQVRIIQGKGAKDGVIYLPEKCIEALMNYLHDYPRTGEQMLFTTIVEGKPYNQQTLRKLMKVLTKRAGITKRVYPYLLRHTLAINMVKRGAHLLYIKEHFRHAFIETTMLYLTSVSMAEMHEQYIPHYW